MIFQYSACVWRKNINRPSEFLISFDVSGLVDLSWGKMQNDEVMQTNHPVRNQAKIAEWCGMATRVLSGDAKDESQQLLLKTTSKINLSHQKYPCHQIILVGRSSSPLWSRIIPNHPGSIWGLFKIMVPQNCPYAALSRSFRAPADSEQRVWSCFRVHMS